MRSAFIKIFMAYLAEKRVETTHERANRLTSRTSLVTMENTREYF